MIQKLFYLFFFVEPSFQFGNEVLNCEERCRANFTACRLDCESTYCHAKCDVDLKYCLEECATFQPSTTTATILTTMTEAIPIAPSEVTILTITSFVEDSYLMSGDGSNRIPININAPTEDYTDSSAFALVHDKIHIFGGDQDRRKIARLDDCSFVELEARLHFEASWSTAALSIENGTQALVCFQKESIEDNYSNSCVNFNGSKASRTFSTRFSHYAGGLGYYMNRPTTVGSFYENGLNKVETLTDNGWISLPEHPRPVDSHNLIGMESGALILLGGVVRCHDCSQCNGCSNGDTFYVPEIWRLRNGKWAIIGNLSKPVSWGSSIKIGSSIYFYPGQGAMAVNGDPIQRLDLDANEEIESITVIGHHGPEDRYVVMPILQNSHSTYCSIP